MFGDLMGKLQEAQSKMQDVKNSLSGIQVQGEAGNGAVKVTATAGKQIQHIEIADALLSPENKQELEDLLITALNRAIDKAETVAENEMKNAAGGMLGGLGLGL
ncbi:YbaB/EbfC family nucleoid-associated protein [Deminuibacter soli]|uniref:Nucleoid-associated protein DXN05_00675 n=1 Tax=Deminuibacter soli TaxID=2291815 RepID=A0A3E1NNN4_9BACT|nr:YbaB/EbfC family nucleoid-associated protein [Deminuibacter soli]RFM29533.1 YbaB/EbfC family nucleoid-associated protein [Deminuibacter soli]